MEGQIANLLIRWLFDEVNMKKSIDVRDAIVRSNRNKSDCFYVYIEMEAFENAVNLVANTYIRMISRDPKLEWTNTEYDEYAT